MKTLEPNANICGSEQRSMRTCRNMPGCRLFLALLTVLGLLFSRGALAGTWAPLNNQAPSSIDTMILLSDGTVLAASGEDMFGNIGNAWYRLTPDTNGSYINGTWSTVAPMNDTRLYYASELLQDGRLFVAGGEYGSGLATGEIYDPIANTWTRLPAPNQFIVDAESRVLPNGSVLVAPVLANPSGSTIIYNPAVNAWSTGGTIVNGNTLDEASWIKLPDDSILTLDTPGTGTNCERYIPSLNQWVNDATLPVVIWDLSKFEMGPGFLCPDGRAIYFGSSGHTAFYTPSGSTSPGSWTAGPDIPNAQGMPDAPGAMLPSGKILLAVGPNGNVGGATNYPGPTAYYEFDPVAGTYTDEGMPGGQPDPNPPFIKRMLCLPDGTVLLSGSNPQLYDYIPTDRPVASGKPTIVSITVNADGSFHIVGRLLNGISEGAQYGDDAQMNSNYPLVRMTDTNGVVYYARTFGWSSTSVMTGTNLLSTEFSLPAGLPPGQYSLSVVANGISSDPVVFAGAATPSFSVVNTIVSGGNGNGIIDFDECNSLFVGIQNVGVTNATSIQAALTTSTPGVTIAQATSTYSDLAAGQAGTNLVPFQVSTTPAFVCGTPVNFTLVLKTAQVTQTRTFTLTSGVQGAPLRYDASTPVIITNVPNGVGSSVVVSNFDSVLMHVSVSAFVMDPIDGNLTLSLVAPDGTTVSLSENNGGFGSNYGRDCADTQRTVFDDIAPGPITGGQAPFVGTFQPQVGLSTFVGKSGTNVNGAWQLVAFDPSGNGGAIECWSLFLTPTMCIDGGGQCPGADMALGLSALPNPVIVQSNITYSISVTNFGPDTATNASLSLSLPTNVVFVSAAPSQGSAGYVSGNVTCNLGTMNVGDVAYLTVVVTPQTVGNIFATATVGSEQPDANPANNSVTIATTVNSATADVSVSLLASPSPVSLDGVLTYTATVVNHGPSTANNVIFTNVLPQNVALDSATTTQGSVAGSANFVIVSIGTLKSGASAIVTIKTTPLVIGSITDRASVSTSTPDAVTANNTASITTTVSPSSDLVLTMSAPSSVVVGGNYNYLLTVQNIGPSAATDVNMRDNLPGSLAPLSANSSQGTVTLNGNTVSCLISNLAVNASATFTITVGTSNLIGNVPNQVQNTATVTADQSDPNVTNNTVITSTLVTYPTLSVVAAGYSLISESFRPTNGMIDPGETVSFAFSLQNVGNINSAGNLTATLLNSGGVTPVGTQTHGYGLLTASGPSVSEPFTFTASSGNGAAITASLQLQNNGTNLAIVTFPLTLSVSNNFANTNDIIIPDHGPGIPYPSTNIVSGLSGVIGKVTVTFTNFNHTYPDDVDMLLVGPGGQNVLLMSHAGYNGLLTNTFLGFDPGVTNADGTAKLLPSSSQILPGVYQPSQYNVGSVDFTNSFGGTVVISTNNPPPSGPWGTNLNVFNGTSANGPWRLYVFDSSSGDQGIIKGGWSLGITTGSEVNPVVDLAVTGKATPNPVLEPANLTYAFTVTNIGPNPASVVQFTNILPTNVTFVSATNSAGTLCATNGSGAVYCTFTNLAAAASVTVTVVVTPTSAGSAACVATVTGADSDPNQSNNSATVTGTVNAPLADLAVTMSGPTNVMAGSPAVYTISVTNNGPGTALGVVVTDATQGVLGFISGSATGSAGQPGLGNQSVICNVGTLAPGAGATINLSLVCTQVLTFTNISSVTTTSTDPATGNNTASLVTVFQAPAPQIVANGARMISGPASGCLVPGQPVTVSFSLANVGSVSTSNLKATLLATNGVTSPGGQMTYGAIGVNASAAENFTFTPNGLNNGSVTAVLQLTDGANSLGTASFPFNLPATNTYANTAAIIIPDHGVATPYPSVVTVSNSPGVVSKATVTLNNFSHQFPDDVEVLLTAPSGQNIVLMAHTGGGSSVTNLVLTFDDAAGTNLPISSAYSIAPLVSGTFLPSDYGLASPFPAPAPSSTTGAALSSFNGIAANGAWTLYVFDNSPGDSGSIANGWALNVTSASPVNGAADLGVALTRANGSVYPGIPFTLNVSVTNKGPATASNVLVSNTLPTGITFLSSTLGSTNSNAGGTTVLNIGSIAAGSSTSFNISAVATGGGYYIGTASVGSDEADINPQDNLAQLGVVVQSPPKLSASAEKVNGAAAVKLSVTGGASGTYEIVASTNIALSLSNWTPVWTTNIGSFQFTDTNTASFPRRYYRVIFTP